MHRMHIVHYSRPVFYYFICVFFRVSFLIFHFFVTIIKQLLISRVIQTNTFYTFTAKRLTNKQIPFGYSFVNKMRYIRTYVCFVCTGPGFNSHRFCSRSQWRNWKWLGRKNEPKRVNVRWKKYRWLRQQKEWMNEAGERKGEKNSQL